MKISKVTMTGADDSIQPVKLLALSAIYPFVEWGILLSRNSQGSNRFPSLQWMDRLSNELCEVDHHLNFSGHLCGQYVRQILMGSPQFLREIGMMGAFFKRFQINTHGQPHDFDIKGLREIVQAASNLENGVEFIFQYDNINTEAFDMTAAECKNVSALFDLSHGAGVLAEHWPEPLAHVKCGYAGGLSPENIIDQLKRIEDKVGDKEIWIDMETHIRSDNDKLFDLKKVEAVLAAVEKTGLISR